MRAKTLAARLDRYRRDYYDAHLANFRRHGEGVTVGVGWRGPDVPWSILWDIHAGTKAEARRTWETEVATMSAAIATHRTNNTGAPA
jgi:hypothetical protein